MASRTIKRILREMPNDTKEVRIRYGVFNQGTGETYAEHYPTAVDIEFIRHNGKACSVAWETTNILNHMFPITFPVDGLPLRKAEDITRKLLVELSSKGIQTRAELVRGDQVYL